MQNIYYTITTLNFFRVVNLVEDKLSDIVHDYIEEYIRSLIPKNEGFLGEMEVYAMENHVPIIHPEVAKFLSFIIKSCNVSNILEVGCAIGYSASVMKMAGAKRITTIERDDEMADLACRNFKKLGIEGDITILRGEAEEILKTMDGSFDMIFLDAAKGQYLGFFPDCHRLLKKGGIIFADNVLFRGMVATNKLLIRRKITIVKRLRKFLKFMMDNEDYDTSILPLSDGVSVSIKIGG